jgi:lantibiotic modifying enzyme
MIAIQVADRLCERAVWARTQSECNWLAPAVEPISSSGDYTITALSFDVYAGTAGIALSLAELFYVTGEKKYFEVAKAAIQRSYEFLNRSTSPTNLLSFYSGYPGLMYVSHRMAQISGADSFEALNANAIERLQHAMDRDHHLDIAGGSAGAIQALLSLGQQRDQAALNDLAVQCGRDICKHAEWYNETCFWQTKRMTGLEFSRPLGGYAHGASGIGVTLLQLFAFTGEEVFLKTARGAFSYEDTLYSAEHRNWLDVRFPAEQQNFPVAWCHGAAGIGMARSKAAKLDMPRAEYYLASAVDALTTTTSTVRRLLKEPYIGDLSLCHGFMGLIEVLLISGLIIDNQEYVSVASDAVASLIDRFDFFGPIPSGIPGAASHPSLMLGVAGVIHSMIRSEHFDRIPPILLIR